MLYVFLIAEASVKRLDLMSDDRPSTAYYRRVADEIEQLAGQSHTPEVRRELLDLARRFRRMAERRERCRDDA